jgi:hypothetical protein
MNHFLRVLSALSIAALPALSLGCSGGAGADGHGGNSTAGGTGAGSTGSGTTAGPMSWTGTWSTHLTYAIDCDYGLGNVKHANQDQTNTMTITDNGQGGLAADVMGYQLAGTGSGHTLTLSGQYPALDDGSSPADNVMADNNVTIAVDTVTDPKHASGTFSGKFVGQFGEKCTISNGVAALSQ